MKLPISTLSRVRGTAAAVAITALAGCGGAGATTTAPPPVVAQPRVVQISTQVQPRASTTNVSTSIPQVYDDYAAACGRG